MITVPLQSFHPPSSATIVILPCFFVLYLYEELDVRVFLHTGM